MVLVHCYASENVLTIQLAVLVYAPEKLDFEKCFFNLWKQLLPLYTALSTGCYNSVYLI